MTWKRSGSVERKTLTRREQLWVNFEKSRPSLSQARYCPGMVRLWGTDGLHHLEGEMLTWTSWRVMSTTYHNIPTLFPPAAHQYWQILGVICMRILLAALAECPSSGDGSDKPEYIHPLAHHTATQTRGVAVCAAPEKYPRQTVRWEEQDVGETSFLKASVYLVNV